MKREILVVRQDELFSEGDFQGFLALNEADFIDKILSKHEYKERNDELENNPEFLQIIPYVWLINPETKKAFLYKRAPSKGEYKEERHLHNYSGGVGGHIDKDTDENSENPIIQAMMRELMEEVIMKNYPLPKIVGFVKDNSNIFNKVHFGVVAIAETRGDVKAADGMAYGDFYSAEEVEKIFSNAKNKVENWTKISWPFIKDYLRSI